MDTIAVFFHKIRRFPMHLSLQPTQNMIEYDTSPIKGSVAMLVYLQVIETQEEQEKFEVLYMEYRNIMIQIASKILNNDFDAEDAVHNAFVTIADNMKKIKDPMCPKTRRYIVTIIESRSIDIYRRKLRQPTVPLEEAMDGLQIEYTGGNALARCIGQLPPRYRHVLTLKYQHGFNNREIAKVLKISEANAIKLAQRAKAHLHELCVKEGIL